MHRKGQRRGHGPPLSANAVRHPRDDSGGIEGLPLHLMILVIVAGLTLAAVLGWVGSIPGPAVIKGVSTQPRIVDLGDVPEDRAATKTVTLKVTAYDANDARIPGVVVTVSGAVVATRVAADDDDGEADGTVTFSGFKVRLPPGVHVGELTLTIQKAGYPSKTWTVPVVRGA